MSSALSTYAFINAKLRARISKLLPEEFFRSIAQARSFVEAIALLTGTRYEAAVEAYSRTGDVKFAELELVRAEWGALGDLERYTPPEIGPFTRAVLAEFEIATVKHALRLWFERTVRGRGIDDKVAYLIRDSAVHPFSVDDCVNAGPPEEIEQALSGRPYLPAIREQLYSIRETGSLFAVEVALDRWYYARLMQTASELSRRDAEIARRLVGIQVDIRNANWIVRMRRYYDADVAGLAESILPGGEIMAVSDLEAAYGSERPIDALLPALGARYAELAARESDDDSRGVERLALLEELLRSILFHEIRRTLGGYPFTIGTVLAYFLLAQNEVRLLVSVLNAKYYELPPERIEELI
jgi:V/A-type H+-transporting ATPase subunit C